MNFYFKLSVFITSFFPLWLTILFIDTLSLLKQDQPIFTEIISMSVIILSNILSVIIIIISISNISKNDYKNYQIINAKHDKGITSEYLLSYILPLFAFDFTKWDSVVEFLIYFVILAFICVRNNNVYANLFFEFNKYKFYECELLWCPEPKASPIQVIVISKKNLTAMKNHTISITNLNKPFYLMKSE